jgi:gluconokinase
MTVLVVMGVSGSGKTTVAALLAGRLGWDLQEGDDLHPPANVAKMHAGHPLTDEDRWPWLDDVAAWIRAHTSTGRPGVITCSALRRIYRDRLRGEPPDDLVFVHVAGSRELLADRLRARTGHYMPAALLDSQFATLEEPGPDEDVVTVDAATTPDAMVTDVITRLRLTST